MRSYLPLLALVLLTGCAKPVTPDAPRPTMPPGEVARAALLASSQAAGIGVFIAKSRNDVVGCNIAAGVQSVLQSGAGYTSLTTSPDVLPGFRIDTATCDDLGDREAVPGSALGQTIAVAVSGLLAAPTAALGALQVTQPQECRRVAVAIAVIEQTATLPLPIYNYVTGSASVVDVDAVAIDYTPCPVDEANQGSEPMSVDALVVSSVTYSMWRAPTVVVPGEE